MESGGEKWKAGETSFIIGPIRKYGGLKYKTEKAVWPKMLSW